MVFGNLECQSEIVVCQTNCKGHGGQNIGYKLTLLTIIVIERGRGWGVGG